MICPPCTHGRHLECMGSDLINEGPKCECEDVIHEQAKKIEGEI